MTATAARPLGRFVWRELLTHDMAAAKQFYGSLFGWTWEDSPMGPNAYYTHWVVGDKQIGGMLDIANLPGGGAHIPPHWTVYVMVDDVDRAAAHALEAGGTLVSPAMDLPDVGRFAVIQDPQGAFLYLFRTASGNADEADPGLHEFCWESLSTPNPDAAAAFYGKVLGWDASDMPESGGQSLLFARTAGNEPREVASVGKAPEGTPSAWRTFVSVADLDEMLAKCRELGGKVLVERTESPVGAFGALEDPTGAVLFLLISNRK